MLMNDNVKRNSRSQKALLIGETFFRKISIILPFVMSRTGNPFYERQYIEQNSRSQKALSIGETFLRKMSITLTFVMSRTGNPFTLTIKINRTYVRKHE
jgi:hypothetical protein